MSLQCPMFTLFSLYWYLLNGHTAPWSPPLYSAINVKFVSRVGSFSLFLLRPHSPCLGVYEPFFTPLPPSPLWQKAGGKRRVFVTSPRAYTVDREGFLGPIVGLSRATVSCDDWIWWLEELVKVQSFGEKNVKNGSDLFYVILKWLYGILIISSRI